ncbi:hypothetical protein T11_10938 [Trichinella zimbabwensis]|uniref:Uncharacterized protein n=1 Tax=Trichinella zimbabwensis TaxID=268475 RepID=A0A0V1GZS7_9BILA|nr:hypothetical protein T11_10938 [Trichinella zimbabwensis]
MINQAQLTSSRLHIFDKKRPKVDHALLIDRNASVLPISDWPIRIACLCFCQKLFTSLGQSLTLDDRLAKMKQNLIIEVTPSFWTGMTNIDWQSIAAQLETAIILLYRPV